MSYPGDVRRILKFIRRAQKGYSTVMKFVDRIKHQIQLVVVIIVVWAVLVLGLAIYIAIRVS